MENYAFIKKSDKSPEGLPHKSLVQEIIKLRQQGYKVIDCR